MNNILGVSAHVLFVLFFQLVYVDWFAVFKNDMGLLDPWEMAFPDVGGTADGHWDNRTVCLGGNLEAALMERKHVQLILIFAAGTFRENADGNAGFHLLNSRENSL